MWLMRPSYAMFRAHVSGVLVFKGGEGGVGLMRFGFDEWHLPASDHVLVRSAPSHQTAACLFV